MLSSHKEVELLGMKMDEWRYKSCVAHFGVGDKWATLADITSEERNKGHASMILEEAKEYYENRGKVVYGTVALNPAMEYLYDKFDYIEITDEGE